MCHDCLAQIAVDVSLAVNPNGFARVDERLISEQVKKDESVSHPEPFMQLKTEHGNIYIVCLKALISYIY